MNCEVTVTCHYQSVRSAIEITVESLEEGVTVLIVENRVGGKLLCEKSLLPWLLFLLSG